MKTVLGVFGDPVAHSRSPLMWNAAIDALGLDAVYLKFHVKRGTLGEALSGMRALGIRGVNLTLPHKEAAFEFLDEVDEAARKIGAINTVRLGEDGKLSGFNTDAPGLMRSLIEGGAKIKGSKAVILGAGGAARAALVGLGDEGADSIVIAARRREAAEALSAEFTESSQAELRPIDLNELGDELSDADLLIQATSATLAGNPHAEEFAASIPIERLPERAIVTDLVYAPLETALLRRANERELKTIDGLGMLIHQGAIAFSIFLGVEPPIDRMRAALGLDA